MNRLAAVVFSALSAAAFAQSEQVESVQVDSQSSYSEELWEGESRGDGHRRRPGRGEGRRRPRPPTQGPAHREMSAESFWHLQQAIQQEPFQDDKLEVLGTAAPYSLFAVSQVGQVLDLFPFGDDKVKALRILNPRILDRANGFQLLAHFRFDDEKEAAKKILAQP